VEQLYKALCKGNGVDTHGAHTAVIPTAISATGQSSKELTMKTSFKTLTMATLLAAAGLTAYAADTSTAPAAPMDGSHAKEHGRRMDPAKMEAMHAKRSAELKAKLKITPQQEGAWNDFVAAMKPPARDAANRPDRAALEKMTTPERLEKMKAMRTQHMSEMNAAMEKRDAATKTFYAALTPDQQKVFDAAHTQGPRGHVKHDKK
jgi:periplasmic protein CpxP/Spy